MYISPWYQFSIDPGWRWVGVKCGNSGGGVVRVQPAAGAGDFRAVLASGAGHAGSQDTVAVAATGVESCCTLDTETPQPAVGSGAEPLGHLGRSGSDSVGGRVRNHADVGGDGDAPETPVGIGGGKPGHTRGSRRVDFGRDIQAVVELGQSPAPESLHPAELHPVDSNLLDLAIYLNVVGENSQISQSRESAIICPMYKNNT